MQLSKNFHLSEFTQSEIATRKGLDNTPTPAIIKNLEILVKNVFQPLREMLEKPVIISSGYRSPGVNSAVGGSSNSQHMFGEAADCTVPGIDNKDLALYIKNHLPFDQLILEFYEDGKPSSGWVHVSYREGRLRKQFLRAKLVNGKTAYEEMK